MLQAEEKAILDAFKPFFEDPDIKKVWHNYSFDRHVMMRMVGGSHLVCSACPAAEAAESCHWESCCVPSTARHWGGGTCRGSTAKASTQTPCTWRGCGILLGPSAKATHWRCLHFITHMMHDAWLVSKCLPATRPTVLSGAPVGAQQRQGAVWEALRGGQRPQDLHEKAVRAAQGQGRRHAQQGTGD
jgi:3'-5' exonuclease